MAIPSAPTLEALEKLSADPNNIVYIISGRDGEFLEQHLGHIKNLGMSAEHGGFIREPGETEWRNFTENLDMDWMGEVLEIFKYYTERTTGSVRESAPVDEVCGVEISRMRAPFDSPGAVTGYSRRSQDAERCEEWKRTRDERKRAGSVA